MLISKIMPNLQVKHSFSLPVISFASNNNFNAQFLWFGFTMIASICDYQLNDTRFYIFMLMKLSLSFSDVLICDFQWNPRGVFVGLL